MRGRDLTGQRYSKLIALYPIDKRSKDGAVYWHCICDCGNEKDIIGISLTKGNTQSCGCLKKGNLDKRLEAVRKEIKERGGTTALSQNFKVFKTSKTGVKGVSPYKRRGKFVGYRASLVCRGKQYHGGIYPTIDEAVEARKELENKYFIK